MRMNEPRMQAYLTCWLALDDSNLENGGLRVVPGSHREGQRDHTMQGVHAVIGEAQIDTARAIPLDAKAGVLVFSSLLVHQTVGNDTRDRQRRPWVIQYSRGDQRARVTRGGVVQPELRSERPLDLRADRP